MLHHWDKIILLAYLSTTASSLTYFKGLGGGMKDYEYASEINA